MSLISSVWGFSNFTPNWTANARSPRRYQGVRTRRRPVRPHALTGRNASGPGGRGVGVAQVLRGRPERLAVRCQARRERVAEVAELDHPDAGDAARLLEARSHVGAA